MSTGCKDAPAGGRVQSKCQGQEASQFFCIGIFAGTARLTAIIRQLGLRDSFGIIDHKIHSKISGPVIAFISPWNHRLTTSFLEFNIRNVCMCILHRPAAPLQEHGSSSGDSSTIRQCCEPTRVQTSFQIFARTCKREFKLPTACTR